MKRFIMALAVAGLVVTVAPSEGARAGTDPAAGPGEAVSGPPAEGGEGLVSGPPAGAATYLFVNYRCEQGSDGRYRAVGSARHWVHSVPNNTRTYYQAVDIRIDKRVLGGGWRNVANRTYDWSHFQNDDLPTYSTSGVRTVVGPTIVSGGELSVRLTVRLKRSVVGPDLTIWRYRQRSPSFYCSGPVGG